MPSNPANITKTMAKRLQEVKIIPCSSCKKPLISLNNNGLTQFLFRLLREEGYDEMAFITIKGHQYCAKCRGFEEGQNVSCKMVK